MFCDSKISYLSHSNVLIFLILKEHTHSFANRVCLKNHIYILIYSHGLSHLGYGCMFVYIAIIKLACVLLLGSRCFLRLEAAKMRKTKK